MDSGELFTITHQKIILWKNLYPVNEIQVAALS
jgi:hypothetical protein